MSQGFTQGLSIPLSVGSGGTGNNTGSLASMNNLPYAGINAAAWSSFTPTLTGFSSTITNLGRYIKLGRLCIVIFEINGTSNATGFSVTNMPFTMNASYGSPTMISYGVDNSSSVILLAQMLGGTTTLTFYNGIAAGAWTSSGNKAGFITFTYETA